MGLHDVDKTHGKRLNPTPNRDDKVVDRLAHGTTQNHNSGEIAIADGLKFFERQIIAKQGGFNKAVFGFDPATGRFALKVADDGQDVLTASGDDLIFNSEQNTFKIVESGTISLNRPAADDSVNTSLPAPTGANAFFAWATISNASPQLTFPIPYYAPDGTGGLLWGVRAYYDADVGVVKFFNESYDAAITAQAYDMTIKYYLLQETLT